MASKYHKYIKPKKDIGDELTERELKKLEKRIAKVYGDAHEEIQKEMDSFVANLRSEEQRWLDDLAAGKVTEKEFEEWKKLQFTRGEAWIQKREAIAETLYNSNQVAADMVNGTMRNIFTINANYAAYRLEKDAGVNLTFSLYNQTTIRKILKDNTRILPSKNIRKQKDKRWNFQNIKNEVAKGIIKGESVPKIAQRLADHMPDRNEHLLQTHARTMVTSAQNQGRMERYHEAEDLGIELQKVWVAALDNKTRYEHAALDGQVRDIDKPFEIEGYQIMEPGDPTAEPVMVYNCRCRMDSVLKNFPRQFTERRDAETGELYTNMTYREWYEAKGGDFEALRKG